MIKGKKMLTITMILMMIMVSSCGQKRAEPATSEEEIPSVNVEVPDVKEDVMAPLEEPESEAETDTVEADTSSDIDDIVEEEAVEEPIKYEAYNVNELGHIMVVMYHGIKDQPPYHRLKEDFIKDLTYLYEHNYQLITMRDYLDGSISVGLGKTPIVFTFDDGLKSTFSLIEVDGILQVNPDTAIGIMEDFAIDHPDFGKTASLYIHDTRSNFRGEGTDVERLTWLVDKGYEIGNHSATHANFKTLTAEGLQKEVGQVNEYVAEVLPDYKLFALTYPYGVRPNEGIVGLLAGGSYKDYLLEYEVAFREGPSGKFYPPLHSRFNPLNTPRVRGSEGEMQDLWWFLEHYEAHPELKYISDGDPTTLVIPANMSEFLSTRKDIDAQFEVIVYDEAVSE